MQEILFWAIVIPTMCTLGWLASLRARLWRMEIDYERTNTSLLALIKSIQAGIVQRHEAPLPYLATIEDEPVISDGQSDNDGKCRPADYDARLISRIE